MQKLKLLKDPGYIFDLFFIFFWNFNREYCEENFPIRDEDKIVYAKTLNEFAPILDDLYIFFHVLDHGYCFMTLNYFHESNSRALSNYNLPYIQNALSDTRDVVKRMIKYYFHWLPEDEIEKCADSDKAVFRVIRKSTYSDTEKSRLYDFFTEPHWYIQQLKYELISKERQLFSYYEKNYFRILDLYNGLVMENLISQLKSVNELFFSEKEEKERYLSFCLLNKDCLLFTPVEEGVVYLLGYNYEDAVEYLQEQKTSIKLSEFGSALAEESRLKILEVMSERGEITCKDLEKACEFSGSTAYHHLMTLLKYGVIKSRNEGKAVLYSVNTKSFDFAIRILSRYAGHKENTAK